MATQTPLTHPDSEKQLRQFFPCSVVFKTTVASGAQPFALESKCAYDAAYGGQSEEFEAEAPTSDRLQLPAWQPGVSAGQLAVLTLEDGTVKRFNVLDAVPIGYGPSGTVVLITPKN